MCLKKIKNIDIFKKELKNDKKNTKNVFFRVF